MNILIVEDDPMVGRINRQFAEKTGFAGKISTAENVEEAKNILLNNEIDLVLLDVYLPDERGTVLLKWIREEEFNISVIFITADRNPATIEKALNLGAADYLVKPFSYERFKEAVQKVSIRLNRLKSQGAFGQETIDSFFGDAAAVTTDELDKGLNKHTHDKILDAIRCRNKKFTAEELSALTGMSRVTVRRYLEYMERNGTLEKKMEYGKPGRPLNYYRLIGSRNN